ncbi:MAG: TetR/AcrR family transcriptional regulator [Rhodobacteraceae bacterium]|nr:TetR/AcrR family transcriptional regulator [Paracoccaceae bacterium]
MSRKTKQPKFKRRADERPKEVLDAALTLFTKQGYAKTTVDQIAREAGLSKGTVYLYFASKEALLEGLVTRTVVSVTGSVFDAMHGYRGDPRPVIARFMQTITALMGDPMKSAVPLLVFREAPAAPAIAALYRKAVLNRALPAITALLAQGVSGGYIRDIDPELTTRTVIGPFVAHLILSAIFDIEPEGGLQLDRLVENHLTILFAGLEPVGKDRA